jgi:hypothetical protein
MPFAAVIRRVVDEGFDALAHEHKAPVQGLTARPCRDSDRPAPGSAALQFSVFSLITAEYSFLMNPANLTGAATFPVAVNGLRR